MRKGNLLGALLCAIQCVSYSAIANSSETSAQNNTTTEQISSLLQYAKRYCVDGYLDPLGTDPNSLTLNDVESRLFSCPARAVPQEEPVKKIGGGGRKTENKAARNDDSDVTPPSFRAIEISRTEFDVTNTSVVVDITLTLFDEGSEIDYAYVIIDPPEGIPGTHSKDLYLNNWSAGEEANTYTTTSSVTFSPETPPGTWTAYISIAYDESSNHTDYSASELIQLGVDPDITVTNSKPVDLTPPTFVSASFSRTEIDVSQDTFFIDITVTVFDEGSEIDRGTFYLSPPEGAPSSHRMVDYVYTSEWREGEEANTYSATARFELNSNAFAGDWSLSLPSLRDTNNNEISRTITADDIVAAGSSASISVTNTNEVDVTPPQFYSISYDQQVIDLSQGTVSLTVTLTLYDEGITPRSAGMYLSPGRNYSEDSKWVWFDNWTKGAVENTYSSTEQVVFTSLNPEGIWQARITSMQDEYNNRDYVDLYGEDLLRLKASPFFTVINGGETSTTDSGVRSNFDLEDITYGSVSDFTFFIEDGIDYDIFIQSSETVPIESFSFSGADAISRSCILYTARIECTLSATGSDGELGLQVKSSLDTPHEYSMLVAIIPTRLLEDEWSDNIIFFPEENRLGATQFGNDGDIDGDGIANLMDVFPFNVSESMDTDADGIGNNADSDDDNDGVTDDAEIAMGTDPLDPDTDGDGRSDGLDGTPLGVRTLPPLADFNSDNYSDLLWKNSRTGQFNLWLMDSGTRSASMTLASLPDSPWDITGRGDFNGDKTSDILWENSNTGEVNIWFMREGERYANRRISAEQGEGWSMVGTGDFNGDGTEDILWRNAIDGSNRVWVMNNGVKASSKALTTVSSQSWQVNGVGDFNGDGTADILWRNGETGQTTVWIMASGSRSSTQRLPTVKDDAWQIVSVGDFDGDNTDDLLWRHSESGGNTVWFMQDGLRSSRAAAPTVRNQLWEVKQTGDFDDDGKADIVWYDNGSGTVRIWSMDGATRTANHYVGRVRDYTWQMISED